MGPSSRSHAFHVGDWFVEPELCRISNAGRAAHVRPKLIDLLSYLAANQGRVVGKDEILEHVWHGEFVVESVLARSVADLRHLLEDTAAAPRVIETIPKRGYRLVAPVTDGVGPTLPATPAVAVLPFADLAPDHDQQYFCDGLAEELTHALSSVPGLRVIARTSAFSFRDQATDVREIGRRLGVGHVIEGSVRRAGGDARVTVQLIDASDGCHRWSGRFDRPLGAVFQVQDDIAQAIVAELGVALVREQDVARRQTSDAVAHEFYLRGRFNQARRTVTSVAAAAEHFAAAISRDPGYAIAHAALADCLAHAAFLGHRAPGEAFPAALAAATRAVELDPALADGHAALALVQTLYAWQWEEGERGYLRALALNPNHAGAHHGYSGLLATVGRFGEALAQAEVLQALDPLSPLAHVNLALLLTEMGRLDRALQVLRATEALSPAFGTVHLHIGRTYFAMGRHEEALAHLQQAPPDFALALGLRGATLGRLGRRDEALAVRRALEQLATDRYVGAVPFALVHQGLGQMDDALAWYARAFDEREGILPVLIVDPVAKDALGDPRFAPLLARMRLPRSRGAPAHAHIAPR